MSFYIAAENRGWVIEKIMTRLMEQFRCCGIDSFEAKDELCDLDTDFHIFMHYQHVTKCSDNCKAQKIAFVYHVDDLFRLIVIFSLLARGFHLLFISEHTRSQIHFLTLGLFSKKLSSVGIASDIAKPVDRRITCGVSSNVYPDKRKNESWILEVCNVLKPNDIEFEFIGKRWDEVAFELQRKGFSVRIFESLKPFDEDYSEVLSRMRGWDLVLYLGFDEGSLGILDAVLSGIDVLVSSQGFHLEMGLSDEDLFTSYSDFQSKLKSKVEKFALQNEMSFYYSWGGMASRVTSIMDFAERGSRESASATRKLKSSKSPCFSATMAKFFWLNTMSRLRSALSRRMIRFRSFR